MRRRSFLKLIGLASVWASSAGASGALAAVTQNPTRGTPDLLASTSLRYRVDGPRVYVSSNNGKSWTLHTYLGPDFAIQRLATDRSGVHLTVGYLSRTFDLNLGSDLRSWLTV
jgi:hypothetical protein